MKIQKELTYPNQPIDVLLLTCNRGHIAELSIDDLYERVKYPEKIRLIVVDDASVDGTQDMLRRKQDEGMVDVLLTEPNSTICQAYNRGFEHVQSEYFLMMQDDIRVPKLEPLDVIEQLIDLMEKYPEQGGIGCRIERIPNMDWSLGNEDIAPARKALSCYFRIQRKSDYEKFGGMDDKKAWDDINFLAKIRSLGLEGSWAKNIWCSHARGYAPDRNYIVKPRAWGFNHLTRMNQAIERKPYPKVDEWTNIPLPGEKIYR
jgi:GT2 family glycosyltransferase